MPSGQPSVLTSTTCPQRSWGDSRLTPKKSARSRPLWVRSLAAPRSHVSSASKVGGEIGLYDVDDDSLGPERTLDFAWGYESFVPRALDTLEQRDQPPDAAAGSSGRWRSSPVSLPVGLSSRTSSQKAASRTAEEQPPPRRTQQRHRRAAGRPATPPRADSRCTLGGRALPR